MHYVYPGYVTSDNDGDRHYIGFIQLCRLYLVDPRNAIDMSSTANKATRKPGPDDTICVPKYNGEYPLFSKKKLT